MPPPYDLYKEVALIFPTMFKDYWMKENSHESIHTELLCQITIRIRDAAGFSNMGGLAAM